MSKILVVDDDMDSTAALAKLLAVWGYKCDQAHDGYQAVSFVGLREYELAIIDYIMPGISGVKLLEHLWVLQPSLPCILLTGYPPAELSGPAKLPGVICVMTKPVDMDKLRPVVEAHAKLTTGGADGGKDSKAPECENHDRAE